MGCVDTISIVGPDYFQPKSNLQFCVRGSCHQNGLPPKTERDLGTSKRAGRSLIASLLELFAPVLLALVWVNAANAQYRAIDLGVIGGATYPYPIDRAYATAINSVGTIAGYSTYDSTFLRTAFIYSGGRLQGLGDLGGGDSVANAINDSGTVVGSSQMPDDSVHAFRYSNGIMTDLGGFGGSFSDALGINNNGTIVGMYQNNPNYVSAFSYANGIMADLGTLGGAGAIARGINALGIIVGDSYTASGDSHAFRYFNARMTDLGTLGGHFSSAQAISRNGIIVGDSETATSGGYSHAMSYVSGRMTDLGLLAGGTESHAMAVNDSGAIVGYADSGSGGYHAFLYKDGAMTDLQTYLSSIGMFQSKAFGIDQYGDIVGGGNVGSNSEHAFLLVVPEPSIPLFLLFGSAVLFGIRKLFSPRQ